MAEQFSLDLLGQHILAVRSDIATIKTDVAAIKDRLDHHQDELSVVSGLAMRATTSATRPLLAQSMNVYDGDLNLTVSEGIPE